MASIVMKGPDPSVKQHVADQAAENGNSAEAEVRRILAQEASKPHIGLALLQAAQSVPDVGELPIPERTDQAKAASFR